MTHPTKRLVLEKVSRLKGVRDWIVRKLLVRLGSDQEQAGLAELAVSNRDAIGLDVISDGLYEKDILYLLFDRVLQPYKEKFLNGVAIDVGANIGNHALFFSSRFQKVIAFEPNPTAALFLRGNLRLNNSRNVLVYEYGLSNQDRKAHLEIREHNNLGSAAVSEHDGTEITLRTLDGTCDNELADFDVCLIKVDVEGHELAVLQGAKNLISTQKPIMMFEVAKKHGSDGADEIFYFLREQGYKGFYSVARDYRFPKLKSPWFRALIRLIFGTRYQLSQWEELDDRFYNCVVALEREIDWL
ncbi:MAG: FkbM family methyltransferase [Pseudomonadales bacterium]|nr:FkbM family methyltransferase [Pseudomonadales bacterium]